MPLQQKGQMCGSLLSGYSKSLVRRKQELRETETASLFGLASLFISEAHGCLLINTSEQGASDLGDSLDSSVQDAHMRRDLQVFRKDKDAVTPPGSQ